ncbi:MAG: hypothetical protein FWF83_04340 [Clostridiales bacterium]|nr:hypothetical protein [Clostridiales bacterium]
MSGPKLSQAQIEQRRQEELERQRREKLRKIRAETELLTAEIAKVKGFLHQIENDRSALVSQWEDHSEMSLTIGKLRDVKKQCKGQLIRAMEIDVPTEPEDIAACTARLKQIAAGVLGAYSTQIKPLEGRIDAFQTELERQQELTAAFSRLHVEEEIQERKHIGDYNFGAIIGTVSHAPIEVDKKEEAVRILAEISELVNNESIEERDMELLLAVADNINKTAFETGRFFEAALQEYDAARNKAVRDIAVFEDLYQDYFAEYVVYLETVNKGRVKPIAITPKEKYQFPSVKALQDEMALLAETSKNARDMGFIRDQIDEVMEEWGYNLSDEIVLFENQRGSHYLCEEKSGQSAIHIHVSDSRQMMMEVVGTGEDRSDVGGGAVTAVKIGANALDAQEREAQFVAQTKFCELHPGIVVALRERGVILDDIRKNPPSQEYSAKILHNRKEWETGGGELSEAQPDVQSGVQSVLYNSRAGERRGRAGHKEAYHEMKLRG